MNYKCYIKLEGLDKSNCVNYKVVNITFSTNIDSLYPENEIPT